MMNTVTITFQVSTSISHPKRSCHTIFLNPTPNQFPLKIKGMIMITLLAKNFFEEKKIFFKVTISTKTNRQIDRARHP